MSFGEVAAAAIRLARDGFPMYPLMAESLKRHEADHRAWPSTAAIFLPNGRLPEPGEVFRQTDLARIAAVYGRRGARCGIARPRGRARSSARRLLSRRHRPEDRHLYEAGGRAALGGGSRRVPLAGWPARAAPLWRSRGLHLRRVVPGASAAANPRFARRNGSREPRAQQPGLHPPPGRGVEARLRRPRGLFRRPGKSGGTARDLDLFGIRRRAQAS